MYFILGIFFYYEKGLFLRTYISCRKVKEEYLDRNFIGEIKTFHSSLDCGEKSVIVAEHFQRYPQGVNVHFECSRLRYKISRQGKR